jgi:hypothetical protein
MYSMIWEHILRGNQEVASCVDATTERQKKTNNNDAQELFSVVCAPPPPPLESLRSSTRPRTRDKKTPKQIGQRPCPGGRFDN